MLDELRLAAARQRANHLLRSLVVGCKRLLSEHGETNSMAIARQLVERIDMLPEEQLGGFFDFLAQQLGPDPQQALRAAQAYADKPDAQRQIALTQAAEPPRQELLRRLNRTPGGTGTLVRIGLVPAAPVVGDTLRLSATGSLVGSGRNIVDYEWSLAANPGVATGFSGATNGPEIELPVIAAGTVAVSLALIDDAGQRSTIQRSITVSATPVVDAPAASDGGGGGGASSVLWVGLLALAVVVLLLTRRRGSAAIGETPPQ
mgnify:CR=1 FL=1